MHYPYSWKTKSQKLLEAVDREIQRKDMQSCFAVRSAWCQRYSGTQTPQPKLEPKNDFPYMQKPSNPWSYHINDIGWRYRLLRMRPETKCDRVL